MAQNAKISGLTDELIYSILKFDPAANKQAYRHAKETASRCLRGHQYARTNQFDVTSSFAGLDEKFRVKNRDDLADALQTRLQKLEGLTNKFRPDFLALLLQLSDRPLENTEVEALDLLRPPTPPLPLTWSEILQDDPYSDEDIWKDIDYAVESSGDERTPKKRGKAKLSPPTSVEDDTYDPEACIIPLEADFVRELETAQYWTAAVAEEKTKVNITELQAVRETLFMLAGLQTSLYQLDKQQSSIRISPRYVLSHAMPDTMEHLLAEFVGIGRDIYRLRQWTKRSSTLPLVQTFKAAVRTRLETHDRALAQLQQQYLTPAVPGVVSLLQLLTDVRSTTTPLLRLAQTVSEIEPELLVNPFSHLEGLFDKIALAQMTLETEVFKYLSGVFFECLQTYLKPIRNWMEAGELGSNDETFFVFQNDVGSDVTSLWHDRYVLRRDARNDLRSPSFLQPAIKKIFNTGKSIIFLKELGIHRIPPKKDGCGPCLDHITVCGSADEVPLSPFFELFGAAFDHWMQSKYCQASSVLRQHLIETSGLLRTLRSFGALYLSNDGAVFENFASALFERLDAGRKGWNDRYVLTELTRGIFGTVMTATDVERIVVRSSKVKDCQTLEGIATISLDFAVPWPIQNIIQRSSIPTYQRILTFLLQVYRIKFLLQCIRPIHASHRMEPTEQLTRKLRHRLNWFADTLRSYLSETVIFFTTLDMDTALNKAEDIDEMSQIHVNYIVKLQKRALLSKNVKPIYEAIMEVLNVGVLFATRVADESSEKVSGAVSGKPKSARRKSTLPLLVAAELSDSDGGGDGDERRSHKLSKPIAESQQDLIGSLRTIDGEFARLLSFITSGLRSVGRVGAEPMWEQLAERLDWEGTKDGV